MGTIGEYTDQRRPVDHYPERIVSPTSPSPCCSSFAELIGSPQTDTRFVFQYKRCRVCGFSVRALREEVPDADLVANLQKHFSVMFEKKGNGRTR